MAKLKRAEYIAAPAVLRWFLRGMDNIKALRKKTWTKPGSLTFHSSVWYYVCMRVLNTQCETNEYDSARAHTHTPWWGQALTLMWNFIMLVSALMFSFYSSVLSNSAFLWAGSRISPAVMPLPYCIVHMCALSMCVCVWVFACCTCMCYKKNRKLSMWLFSINEGVSGWVKRW